MRAHILWPLWFRPVNEPEVVSIDGGRFDDLAGFYDELEGRLDFGSGWGRNLDALEELLGDRGKTLTLRWLSASRSREQLGFEETARWLERASKRAHPDNRAHFERRLESARRGEGTTLFETLVGLITASGVKLVLVD
jgi:RNAse (barnase) inhibitor barstar